MFCSNCGSQMNDNARFCPQCGAQPEAQTFPASYSPPPPQPAPQTAPQPTYTPAPKNKGKGWILLIVAVLLFFLGIGQLALTVAGKSTSAKITKYTQRMYLNNDESTRNPNRYEVLYEFTVEGKRYTGSVTKIFNKGIVANSDGSSKPIRIRYLPFWPHINGEDDGKSSIAGLAMLGLGVLLLFAFFKTRPKKSVRP